MKNRKVMAIASGGGHWVQLMRLRPAFEGMDVFYVSLDPTSAVDVPDHRYYTVSDVSRRNKWISIIVACQLLRVLMVERPRVVITTGSAPALIAIMLAKKLFRSRTIWIDSIANVERLSTSGEKAGKLVDIWLTQWPNLKGKNGGPDFWGAVL